MNNNTKIEIINDPRNALDYARKIANKTYLIVLTGSIYLVGEIT